MSGIRYNLLLLYQAIVVIPYVMLYAFLGFVRHTIYVGSSIIIVFTHSIIVHKI